MSPGDEAMAGEGVSKQRYRSINTAGRTRLTRGCPGAEWRVNLDEA